MDVMDCESRENERIQTTILDLNEYCLLKIFRYFDLWDMVNVGQTCKLFEKVAQMAAIKFKKFVLHSYIMHLEMVYQPISLDKIFSYIAPHIEKLYTTERMEARWYTEAADRYQLGRTFMQYNFPKLRSITVEKSGHLEWIIDKTNVKKLNIHTVERSDLNNFTVGMTQLTHLLLRDIRESVPVSEVSHLVENNPNIEVLQIKSPYERVLPQNFFAKLPKLKVFEIWLDTSMDRDRRNLMTILQIEQLTSLALEFTSDNQDVALVELFLERLAQKNTVTSLELRGRFDNPSLIDILASMNLISMRLVTRHPTSDLLHVNFPTLKVLDLLTATSIEDVILLLYKFTTLERLIFCSIQDYNFQTLSERIKDLLEGTRNRLTRPDVELEVHIRGLKVKVKENYSLKL